MSSNKSSTKGRYVLKDDGLFYVELDVNNIDGPEIFLCSKIEVIAKMNDPNGGNSSILLRWFDGDKVCEMPVLMRDLSFRLRLVVAKLVDRGLSISPLRRNIELLGHYLMIYQIDEKVTCFNKPGWQDSGGAQGEVFVTPKKIFCMNSNEHFVYQNSINSGPPYAVSGTSQDWIDSVAKLARGNHRLIFAISLGFAAPLLRMANMESGGFNFHSGTSCGKTTAAKSTASVYGNPSTYVKPWHATTNGLEGLAVHYNDAPLILDELSQIDPQSLGDAIYMLSNSQGRIRSTSTGALSKSSEWRLLFLSTGEETLASLMNRAGMTPNKGQVLRFADIDADAGENMGIINTLNGYDSSRKLIDAINQASSKFHGAVGVDWLSCIVKDRQKIIQEMDKNIGKLVNDLVKNIKNDQVLRVAKRFALVALAGELATSYGLTGWAEHEAFNAVSSCFESWLKNFGAEESKILSQVRAFFDLYGNSRFEYVKAPCGNKTFNRAGFYSIENEVKTCFFVLPSVFKEEICSGFNEKLVRSVLIKAGWLTEGEDNRPTQKPYISSIGKSVRCYCFTQAMWDYDGLDR